MKYVLGLFICLWSFAHTAVHVDRNHIGHASETATATIRYSDLGTGSKATDEIRKEMQAIGKPGDDAGHLISKMLGGPGDSHNFVPMKRSPNKEPFKDCEEQIRDDLEKNPTHFADISIDIYYNPSSKYPQRPNFFFCRTDTYDAHHNFVSSCVTSFRQ
jgi:hypothetical protein